MAAEATPLRERDSTTQAAVDAFLSSPRAAPTPTPAAATPACSTGCSVSSGRPRADRQ